MGKFDFLRVMIHAMGIAESGKIHASTRFCVWEPAPAFFMKGVTVAASAPPEIIRLAAVCPYGIITTNRKSPVESRVLRFSVWFFILFQTEKSR